MPAPRKKKPVKRKRPTQEAIYVLIKKSNAEVESRHSNPGKIKCLGWCNKEFVSPNKIYVRYCTKCSEKKDDVQKSHSLRTFNSSGEI